MATQETSGTSINPMERGDTEYIPVTQPQMDYGATDISSGPVTGGLLPPEPPIEPPAWPPVTSGTPSGGEVPPVTGAAAVYSGAQSALSGMDTSVSGSYIDPNVDGLYAKPGSSYITPEATVAGQLESIMSKDSALMKRSAAIGKQQANALGLQSSTAGVGIVAGALYDRALSIATPDAQTHAAAQLAQQKADLNINQTLVEGKVSTALQTDKANLDAQTLKMRTQFDLVMQGADAETKESLQQWMQNFDHESSMAQIEAQGQIEKMLQDGLIDANRVEQGKQAMMQQLMNTQISIENALRDPEILALGPEAMNALLTKLKDVGIATLKATAGTYGIPATTVNTYASMITFDFEVPPVTPETDPFGWGNYSGVPAPSGVTSGQWANESWRMYYIKTHPNMIGPSGKPKWF